MSVQGTWLPSASALCSTEGLTGTPPALRQDSIKEDSPDSSLSARVGYIVWPWIV